MITIKEITSKDNTTYKKLLALKKGNQTEQLLLAEGDDLILEALKENCLKLLLLHKESKDLPISVHINDSIEKYLLSNELFRSLSSYKCLPNCIGVCQKKLSDINNLGEKVIYLDNVQDPGNVGTIIRSALSFSFSSIVLSNDCVSVYNNKLIQASKGSIFKMPISIQPLKSLKELNYNIYLTTLDGEDEKNFVSLKKPYVLVFGNEGKGIREEYLSYGKKLKIAMSNIDSLNVAIAASIFMYRFKD